MGAYLVGMVLSLLLLMVDRTSKAEKAMAICIDGPMSPIHIVPSFLINELSYIFLYDKP